MPTKPTAKVRTTSKRVRTSDGCAPLREMYARAVDAKPTSWGDVEEPYLRALEQFDDLLVAGTADMGDLQNGKGDFFNDILALIVENCADVQIYSRRGVPGFIFTTHNLDVTYPNEGVAKFLAEAKALGTPKHPGSPKAGVLGRPGSADIKKRVTELAFKTIDLKVESARIEKVNTGGNLTTWLRTASPKTYLFVSARVISDDDLAAVLLYAERAKEVLDGVGVFAFRLRSDQTPTRYEPVPAGMLPESLQIARTLYRACQDVSSVKGQITPIPQEVVQEALTLEAAEEAAAEDAEPEEGE